VKKLPKSVNIFQSYRKNKSGTFFYGPRCILNKFITLVAPPSDKINNSIYSLAKSSETTAFKCQCLKK